MPPRLWTRLWTRLWPRPSPRPRPTPRPTLVAAACLALCAGGLAAQEAEDDGPLSAIDWLSQSVDTPASASGAGPANGTVITLPPPVDEPPVASDASTPEIVVTSLDRPSTDGVGLLAPSVTGLPRDLWAHSPEEVLTTLIRAERVDTLPAIRDLLVTLMLAEADPPMGADQNARLFLARVDKLLDMGALEAAQALLEQTDRDQAEVFRRWFDISLLTGTEDDACDMLRAKPALSPTYPARIFCLARTGDWTAAALTLNTARALGDMSEEDEALLSRFLDPELYEDEGSLPAPSRVSPLVFRLREAIGEPIPVSGLPRAFAHADLRSTAPWRNRIEAAERLSRYGAVSENLLLGLYTERRPAASGGVWDRAAAMQAFEGALANADLDAVADRLPAAWEVARAMRLEVPFARLFGAALLEMDPDLTILGETAFRVALLSPQYEQAALVHQPANASERLWIALARGDVEGLDSSRPNEAAVIAGFTDAPLPEPMASQIEEGRLGEALLRAVSAFHQGLDGDAGAITDALLVLRHVGMEEVARKAALQYLILDRPS